MEENYDKYLGTSRTPSLRCSDVVYGAKVRSLFTGRPQRGDAVMMVEADARGRAPGKRSQGELEQVRIRAGWGRETSM